jgi:hypothetical protein
MRAVRRYDGTAVCRFSLKYFFHAVSPTVKKRTVFRNNVHVPAVPLSRRSAP